MRNRLTILPVLTLIAFLGLTWETYSSGLHGGFLFDDFGNLPSLGASGAIDNWSAFWRYITSGIADPTGRPLTLLSFLLDAHNWPADPYPFKRTSLILHLFNGILLAVLLRQLGLTAFGRVAPRRIEMAAVLGAAFWLLHPLLVSTTLYIVQREAMLPATFTLLGLLLWLRGRRGLQCGQSSGLIWIALGLGGCTLLGVLSKANGILLPVLALVIEYVFLPRAFSATEERTATKETPCDIVKSNATELAPSESAPSGVNRTPEGNRCETIKAQFEASPFGPPPSGEKGFHCSLYAWATGLFVWVPTALVVGYLLRSAWIGFVDGVSALRPWTMGQRLLTEPRVLMQYLDLLWLPRPFTPGLFNDQIRASLSLWSPATTLPALLAVLGLIVSAWVLRRRRPAFALAILFYFVGQSLESSTIPLELYFEHRNYLPAMLMFWPLALWLCGVRQGGQSTADMGATSVGASPGRDGFARHHKQESRAQGELLSSAVLRTDWAKGALATVLLLGLVLMTHARAALWGNTHDQGVLWATLNPDSPRAQANAALLEMAAGQPRPAIARLEMLLRAQPDEVQLAFNLIGAHCMLGALGPNDLAQARYAISNTRDPGSLVVHWFDGSIPMAVASQCRGLDLKALESLLDAGLANHPLMDVHGRHQDLLYLKGRIMLARHDPAATLRDFNAALDQDVRPDAALEQAALLGAAGYPQEGLKHLEHYKAVHHRQVLPGFGMPWLHSWVLQHQHYWPKEIARLHDTLQQDAKAEAVSGK